MIQTSKLANKYNAKLSGYDISEYDKEFGDDYLKCNDLSTNRRGLKLLNIDESLESLKNDSQDIELAILIGRDDIETIDNYKELKAKVVLSANTPKENEKYDLYLPILTHTSKEGSYVNIDGYLQFSKAHVENPNETQSLTKIISLIFENNISTCKI